MGNFLTKIGNSVSQATGRTGLVIQKYSPEILMGIGIVSFGGAIITACRATLRAEGVLEKHYQMMSDVEEAAEICQNTENVDGEMMYAPTDIARDKAIIYAKTTKNFVKLYAPSMALAALSLTCILSSENIIKKRYLGAVAAYNAVSGAFESYRNRVKDEMGEEADRRFLYGEKREELEVIDEKGKKHKEEIIQINDEPSGYARVFDSRNRNWDEDPTMSLMFLKAQQEYANHILNVRGHIFLNEIYDMLGFDHSQAGAVVGWVKGMGDSYVDFGLSNIHKEGVRKFINGYDNIILLDFNVDGVILDKVGL